MKEKALIKKLFKMVKANEWQERNSADNQYCPFCATTNRDSKDYWRDQEEHRKNCKFVTVVEEAERYLMNAGRE